MRCPGGYLPCRAGSSLPPPCSLLTFGILWPGGETEAQGEDLRGYKARWPAPFLGFSTGGCPPLNLTPTAPPHPAVVGWGLERGRGCPGLPAVHFDPGSLPARLHGRSWALQPPTSTLPPGQLPTLVPGGRGSRTASPFQVAVGRGFLFCFVLFLLPFV